MACLGFRPALLAPPPFLGPAELLDRNDGVVRDCTLGRLSPICPGSTFLARGARAQDEVVEAEKDKGPLPLVQVRNGARAVAPEPGFFYKGADVGEGCLQQGRRSKAGHRVAPSPGNVGLGVPGVPCSLGTLQKPIGRGRSSCGAFRVTETPLNTNLCLLVDWPCGLESHSALLSLSFCNCNGDKGDHRFQAN